MKILKILLLMIFFTQSVYSYNNPDVVNREYRIKEITKYLKKEEQIINIVENYIFLTGDLTPTKEEINTFYNFETNFWKGVANLIEFQFDNGTLILSNSLTEKNLITIDKITEEMYKQYKNKNINSFIKDNKVFVKLNINTTKLINFIKNLPEDYVIANSNKEVDTSKKKLEYEGNGFKISTYDKANNEWKKLGVYDLNDKKGLIVNSIEDLSNLGSIKETKAFIVNTSGTIEMKYSKNGWEQVSGVNTNFFIGDGTILDAACKIYNYDGGSEITINPEKETYVTNIEKFMKIDEANYNGFWINTNKTLMIIKDMEDTKYLTYSGNNNVKHIFICSPEKDKYFSLQKQNINGNQQWVVLTNSFEDLISFTGTLFDNQWFYVADQKLYFYKLNSIFYSKYNLVNSSFINFEKYVVGAGTRDLFKNVVLENKTYLTTLDDCPVKNNCSGETTQKYGGQKIGGLYSWSNINGELQDLISSSLSIAYDKGYTYFYDTNKKIYLKKIIDNNENFCYVEINNLEKVYMKNSELLLNEFIINNSNIKSYEISFPNKNIGCFNNLNNKYIQGTYKDYKNEMKILKGLNIENLYELSYWQPKEDTNAFISLNNETLVFTYKNKNWLNYKISVAKGDRSNLYYLDNGVKKLYYTSELGTGYFYNNGYFDTTLKLYVWEYEPTSTKQLNGFIDIFFISSFKIAYANLDKIYKEVYINSKKFIKKTFTNSNLSLNETYNKIVCLIDESGIAYNSSGIIIPQKYFSNDMIEIPLNTTCSNVLVHNNLINITSLDYIKDLTLSNDIIYNSEIILKPFFKNNFFINDSLKPYILVYGNRYSFDYNTYLLKNYTYEIYTTIDDSNKNTNYSTFGENKIYKWQYLYTNDSINNLVSEFKPKNCKEILNYLNISSGTNTIYTIYNTPINVVCDNGNTIIKNELLKDFIKLNYLTNTTKLNFTKDNLTFSFYNNSDNAINISFNIPIVFNSFSLKNFNIIDNSQEIKYSDKFKTSTYDTTSFNNFKVFLENQFSNLIIDTNYFSFGLYGNNGTIIDETGFEATTNINKTNITSNKIFEGQNIKFLLLFHNKDNTTNNIVLDNSLSITLYN